MQTSKLLALTQVPLRSIADVEACLTALTVELEDSDLRMLNNFNKTYLVITQRVRLEFGRGSFDYPEFIERFDVRFAEYYLEPIRNYLQGQPVAPAWQIVFDRAKRRHGSPFKLMALGVNAHVNNDIALALADCKALDVHQDDYFRINHYICSAINRVLDELADDHRPQSSKHQMLKPFYKACMCRMIIRWRKRAWQNYQGLRDGKVYARDMAGAAARTARLLGLYPI